MPRNANIAAAKSWKRFHHYHPSALLMEIGHLALPVAEERSVVIILLVAAEALVGEVKVYCESKRKHKMFTVSLKDIRQKCIRQE